MRNRPAPFRGRAVFCGGGRSAGRDILLKGAPGGADKSAPIKRLFLSLRRERIHVLRRFSATAYNTGGRLPILPVGPAALGGLDAANRSNVQITPSTFRRPLKGLSTGQPGTSQRPATPRPALHGGRPRPKRDGGNGTSRQSEARFTMALVVDETTLMLDSTTIKMRQHASGVKKGASTRQRGGAVED